MWRIGGVDAVTSVSELESNRLDLGNIIRTFDGRLKWWVDTKLPQYVLNFII